MQPLLIYSLLINLVAFIAMGRDKRLSKTEGARRIPEKTLFTLALLGGGWGAAAGMFHFRHKTRHWYFRLGLPAIAVTETGLLVWLVIKSLFEG